MFRNPRENAQRLVSSRLPPSVGRPPTPPPTPSSRGATKQQSFPTMKSSTSPYFRSSNGSFTSSSSKKAPVKRNKSILSFFQKADGPPKPTNTQHRITRYVTRTDRTAFEKRIQVAKEKANGQEDTTDGLFFEEDVVHEQKTELARFEDSRDDKDFDDIEYRYTDAAEDERYNERGGALKKRKLDSDDGGSMTDMNQEGGAPLKKFPSKKALNGPFVDESDSEGEDNLHFFQGELGEEAAAVEASVDFSTADGDGDEKSPFRDTTDPEIQREVLGFEEDSGPNDIVPDVGKDEICDGDQTTPCESDDWATPTRFPEDEVAVCPICCARLDGLTDTVGQHVSISVTSSLHTLSVGSVGAR